MLRLDLVILAAIALGACAPSAASRLSVVNPTMAAIAMMDEYRRDAEATVLARDAAIAQAQADLRNTAVAATNTASASMATAQALATADAVATQMYWGTVTAVARRDATATAQAERIAATGTAVAEASATQVAAVAATGTAVHEAHATGTAVVVATQTAIRLEQERAGAFIATVLSYALAALSLSGVAALVYAGYHFVAVDIANRRKRGSVVTVNNGQDHLVILDGASGSTTVVNPNALPVGALGVGRDGKFSPLGEYSAEDQAKAVLWNAWVRWQQAHNPPPTTEIIERRELANTEWERIVRTGLPAGASRPTKTSAALTGEPGFLALGLGPTPNNYHERITVSPVPPASLPAPTREALDAEWKEVQE